MCSPTWLATNESVPPISTTQIAMSACQGTAWKHSYRRAPRTVPRCESSARNTEIRSERSLLRTLHAWQANAHRTRNSIVQIAARRVNIFLTTSDFYGQILGSVSSRQQSIRLTHPHDGLPAGLHVSFDLGYRDARVLAIHDYGTRFTVGQCHSVTHQLASRQHGRLPFRQPGPVVPATAIGRQGLP